MTELEKILYITNNVIIKKIKKQIYNIRKSKLDNQIKNNLIMSGEILINIYKDYQKNNVFYGTLQLRNVFEGTLKAITLDKSEEIKKSYNVINKSKKHSYDEPAQIKDFVKANFKEFFYIFEEDKIINKILDRSILDYIYNILCNYSHASKLREILYYVLKDKHDSKIISPLLAVFLIDIMYIMYIDAVSKKLNTGESQIIGDIVIYLTRLFDLLIYMGLNMNDFKKLNKYNKYMDLENELNTIYFEKIKELNIEALEDLNKNMGQIKELENLIKICITNLEESVSKIEYNIIVKNSTKIIKKVININNKK